jgi:hypothetical protein
LEPSKRCASSASRASQIARCAAALGDIFHCCAPVFCALHATVSAADGTRADAGAAGRF